MQPAAPQQQQMGAGGAQDDESMLKLADGSTCAAADIEAMVLQQIPAIEHAMVVGSGRPKLCCVLTLKTSDADGTLAEPALAVAQEAGSASTTVAMAKTDAKYRYGLLHAFARANKQLPAPRKLNRFAILAQPLSVAAGTLHPGGAINRMAVKQKNVSVIEGMYKT